MEAAVDMAMAAIVHEARKLRQGGPAQEGLDILENDINVRAWRRLGRGREGDGRTRRGTYLLQAWDTPFCRDDEDADVASSL